MRRETNLLVLDDLHVQRAVVKDGLDGGCLDPKVVGVEIGELVHTLEVFHLDTWVRTDGRAYMHCSQTALWQRQRNGQNEADGCVHSHAAWALEPAPANGLVPHSQSGFLPAYQNASIAPNQK